MKNSNEFLTGLTAAWAACVEFNTLHLAFAADITTGRARAMVAAAVGLISVIIGGFALSRSRARTGGSNWRVSGILAVVPGLIGMVLSVMHLGTSTGGFGTGGGRAGAIVALVLSLIGINLGGLVLARSRRSRGAE
jgi:hypothetical protein